MSKYSKNLSGVSERVIVIPNVNVTAAGTFAAFVNGSDANGVGGFFLADGTAKTTPQAAGESVFFAQKRDGQVWRTPVWKFEDIVSRREQLYVAPVKQVTALGYIGSGSLDINLNFTGASLTNTLTFGITVRDTTPGNQPFPIQEGYATVNSATADEYTVLAAIVSQLNGDFDYERVNPDRFVIAEILGNGAITESAANPTVTNGSQIVTFSGNVTIATGAKYIVRGVVYNVATGVTAGTQITLDRPYTGATETIDVVATVDLAGTMAYTSGTTLLGVRFTAIDTGTTFSVQPTNGLYAAPVTTTTAFVLGAGYYDNINELESREGAIFEGVGSTANVAFKEDYGQPTRFAVAGGTYDQWFLDAAMSIVPSADPLEVSQKQMMRLHFCVHTSSNMAGTTGTVADVLGLG